MTATEQYYRQAGYWSLAPLLLADVFPFVFGYFSFDVTFILGVAGLCLAISGIWKGKLGAKICAVISLLLFAELAMTFLAFLWRY